MSGRDKISPDEACCFLECAHPKLMELLGDGTLPGLKYGKAWVIPREAFLQAVNQLAFQSAETIKKDARLAEAEKRRMENRAVAMDFPIARPGRARIPRSA